ncbi:non-heme iron oxygenase ferredoxin subunit [Microbacterium kribbense]|uniref:Non-heme iron oxygenase ferredoxin subunit n=1 Tax=Microbacterium kribbense TaxID=433645 RepID=A0ABP7GWW5_9MICO
MAGDASDEGVVVAQIGDIDDGWGILIDASVTGTVDDIAVFNDRGEYFALDNSCSHMQGPLSDGYVSDGTVECPVHQGRFCLRDGSVVSDPPTEPVASHRVSVDGTDIRVTPNPARLASGI